MPLLYLTTSQFAFEMPMIIVQSIQKMSAKEQAEQLTGSGSSISRNSL
jgi:hypothetical protein